MKRFRDWATSKVAAARVANAYLLSISDASLFSSGCSYTARTVLRLNVAAVDVNGFFCSTFGVRTGSSALARPPPPLTSAGLEPALPCTGSFHDLLQCDGITLVRNFI